MKRVVTFARRIVCALLVGYMIAWHNVYKQDMQMPNSIELSIEEDEVEDDMQQYD